MYIDWKKDKYFLFWVLGTTIGLVAGLIAGFLCSIVIYDFPPFRVSQGLINFFGSAIAGLVLGFCQGIPLAKLLKQKGLSSNTRRMTITWILATAIGFSIGGRVTSLWTHVDGTLSANMLIFKLFIIFILIGLAQGIMMKWSIKKISQWLLAYIISILASVLVGVFLYFVSTSLAVGLTGGGLGALAVVLIIAPLLISLSSGLIYGSITFFFLPSLLNNNEI